MASRAEILIAEDEPSARRGFRALFEGEGYAVRIARDGEEALAKFREHRPDAVLLDVMMPKMNGIAACSEIRKSDPLVPILFFTAMPSDVGAVRALGLGADDYIDKAKSPEELLARVAAMVREKGWEIVNVDNTLLAQKPKIAPFVPAMRQALADTLGLPVEAVSVKATTTEHLGFVGREEGVAAYATCLLCQR